MYYTMEEIEMILNADIESVKEACRVDAEIDEDLFEDVWAEEEWSGPDMETGFDPYEGCYTWDC